MIVKGSTILVAVSIHYSPHTYELVLICQVNPPVKVVGLDGVNGGPEEVLGAAVGGQVVEGTIVLGNLRISLRMGA